MNELTIILFSLQLSINNPQTKKLKPPEQEFQNKIKTKVIEPLRMNRGQKFRTDMQHFKRSKKR